jgi:hypothetical protein
MNGMVLLQGGFPPVVITSEQRPDDVDALETRHVASNSEPWSAFMAARLIEGLEHDIQILDKEQQSEGDRQG